MAQEHTYPTIRLGVMQGLLDLKLWHDSDPICLHAKACPYDSETVELLEKLFAARIITKTVEVQVEATTKTDDTSERKLTGEERDTLATNVRSLLKDLYDLGDGKADKFDTQTKIQIIKAKAALIEQVIKVQERVMNIRRVADFHTVVLSILDDVVSEDGRDIFLKRMEPYRE